MKRTLVLGFVCLILVLPVGSRQALPTLAQCRADQNYFGAQAERSIVQAMSSPKHYSDIDRLPVQELRKRSTEMGLCGLKDPDNAIGYETASTFWASVAEQREFDFIKRHQLLVQFYAEDAKGLR